MSGIRKLPPFDQTIGAALIQAREAVLAPLRPILREHNITEPQWRVLRVINERVLPDATGLAEAALLHGSSLTRILKELEERRLIVRKLDPEDRRRMMIGLTPAGRELIRSTGLPMVRVLRQYAERFGTERLDRLTTELRALSAVIKGVV